MIISKPPIQELPEYCIPYISKVTEDSLITALEHSMSSTIALMDSIPEEKSDYAYAAGKWTIREVIRHIIDCERIFSYRALRFSRLDPTPLPGFEEDDYIENTKAQHQSMKELREEYVHVRVSTIMLYKPMTEKMLDFKGSANNKSFSARIIGFMTAGHNQHHCNVLRERYLV